jgi:hypothetical protein
MMRGRLLPSLVLLGALFSATTGCRTDTSNIEAWGSKSQGPRKLVSVLTHDKYSTDLRIEAALMLVSMKPRGGRRIGIQGTDEQPGLIDALAQMPPAARTTMWTFWAVPARKTAAWPAELPPPTTITSSPPHSCASTKVAP